MLAVITASSREERTPALQPSEVQRRPRQRLLAVAGVALVLIAGIVGVGSTIRRKEPAWAAEAIAVAKSSPRYLLADPAWELIRADEFSRTGRDPVLAMLESVDIDRWLSAMPASVVRPDSHAAVVEEMLADVPLPDGFDAEELIRADTVLDRYQLGAEVTGAVACGWVEQWLRARKTGDTVRAREAVEAMPSSRDWAILKDCDPGRLVQ